MEVLRTKLDGVLLIKPVVYEDFRGHNIETYSSQSYPAAGIPQKFIHDAISCSSKNVLRGFHGDQKTWKLISCLFGKVYFVVVNWDPSSSQYCQWESFSLSGENGYQILIPPKFGNAHLVLSEKAVFSYKQSEYYDRAGQFTIMWNEPKLNVWWPIKEPILSKRDLGLE